MKKIILPFIAFPLLMFLACGKSDLKNTNSPTPVPSASFPANGNYNGRGKISKINDSLPSVEMDHEAIAGLMPAMQMEFYVKDKALLEGLNVGDAVEFVLEYKHPAETIVGIKKVK